MRAKIADDDFLEVVENIKLMRSVAEDLFEKRDIIVPAAFSLPDPADDGKVTAQVLYEQGVDYANSEYLGIASHMNNLMIAMYNNSSNVGSCYIGLADGTHIAVNDMSSDKYDESGRLIPFPVRERPWYKGAVEAGDIYFTGLENDTYTDGICITCSAPVTVDGKLVAVVGIDVTIDNMDEIVKSKDAAGFSCVVSDRGQVIFAPEDNGIFDIKVSAEAEDLTKSDNKDLAELVSRSLSEPTGLSLVTINGRDYYMCGSPMKTVGWSVITVVDKEITEQPTKQMLDEYSRINDEATDKFETGVKRTEKTTLVMILLVMILGSAAALFVANRIVRPIEHMTARLDRIKAAGGEFEMDEIYRTGDEIQVLAESFKTLSDRTRQYITEITEITKEKERIGTELELANKIQADMLPNIFPPFPERPEFDLYATMTPAKEVGGDFYDFFLIDDDHLCMVMADVSGKGVPAALFMMMSKILVNNFANMGISPAKVLEQTNTVICKNNEEEMFVTVWLGIMEISTGKVTAANAGHEYPVIKSADGGFELLKDKHGFVVGGMEGVRYKEYEFTIDHGGALFLYTDGVPEATNSENELFGTDRMLTALNAVKDAEPKELLVNVKQSVDDFVGEAPQFDDLTMLAFVRHR